MIDGVSDVVELTAGDGGDEGGGQFHRIWVVKKRSLKIELWSWTTQ